MENYCVPLVSATMLTGWVIWETLEGQLHFKVKKEMLTHSKWCRELSVSPGSSLSQVHFQSNQRIYTYPGPIRAP